MGDDVEFKGGVVVLPALGGPDIEPAQHTTEHLAQRGESPSCPNARALPYSVQVGSRSVGHTRRVAHLVRRGLFTFDVAHASRCP